jgi:hypothetical protein
MRSGKCTQAALAGNAFCAAKRVLPWTACICEFGLRLLTAWQRCLGTAVSVIHGVLEKSTHSRLFSLDCGFKTLI